jgi:site-specific recombinase XerD
MPGDPHSGSKVWKAPDREIGKPGENRGTVIANQDTAKDPHKRVIALANEKAKPKEIIRHFQPYILRHTALTQLAEAGCDVFTLARIAGHSSITITQRYVHPQADAIERAFQMQTTKTQVLALLTEGK